MTCHSQLSAYCRVGHRGLGNSTIGLATPPASSDAVIRPGQQLHPCITGDTLMSVANVSIRDLRNHGGEVIDRVIAGERVTITRDGRRVAEFRAAGRTPLPAAVLLERWSRLPQVDPVRFRHDVDTFLDPRV